jgi:hypothetical protein
VTAVRVAPLVRNARADVACRYIGWLYRHGGDQPRLGRLHACVVLIHDHRMTGREDRLREGLLLVAEMAAGLDGEEVRVLAEGVEEDYTHDDSWFAALAALVEEERHRAGLLSGAVLAWDLAEEPHRDRAAAWDEALADLDGQRREIFQTLLTPAGGGQ